MISKITGIKLKRGERLRLETPGGGGWGDPAARTAEAMAADVANGLVNAKFVPSTSQHEIGAGDCVQRDAARPGWSETHL